MYLNAVLKFGGEIPNKTLELTLLSTVALRGVFRYGAIQLRRYAACHDCCVVRNML
jgi:hypothetical protein